MNGVQAAPLTQGTLDYAEYIAAASPHRREWRRTPQYGLARLIGSAQNAIVHAQTGSLRLATVCKQQSRNADDGPYRAKCPAEGGKSKALCADTPFDLRPHSRVSSALAAASRSLLLKVILLFS